MSLLWRDQLRFALAPGYVAAVRLSGGFNAKIVAKELHHCDAGTPGWKGVLDTLTQTVLSREEWQKADAVVVLSNHFVRYQLLPWSDEIGSDEELLAYARLSLSQVYGEVVGEWIVTVDRPCRGRPTMACAIDRGLLEGLDSSFRAANVRLVSVKPYLAAAFNRLRESFTRKSAWFIAVENGKVLMLLARNGVWQVIATRKVAIDSWSRELQSLMERERLLNGISEGPQQLYLLAPEMDNASLHLDDSWHIEWLQQKLDYGLTMENDPPYAMALA